MITSDTIQKQEGLGIFIVAGMVLVTALAWKAYVLSVLWTWFVVPAFGLQPIGVAVAFGLLLIVALLRRYRESDDKPVTPMRLAQASMHHAFDPAFCLLFGYVAKAVAS